MENDAMQRELEQCRAVIEAELASYFVDDTPWKNLTEAMRYSLLAGGKRIRPIIVMQFCKATGGDMEAALPAACAVERLHTYSLIHDDLPCMDDDELRRGKPTNHMVYGECTAVLAGDALQAAAFETLFDSALPPENVVRMGRIFARAVGASGICGGQILDMEAEGKTLTPDEVARIHEMKTAALLVAAAQMGAIAGNGTDEQVAAAGEYAAALGMAFQIRDDILDCIVDTETLGKPAGSDNANQKSTFVSLYGLERAEALVRENTQRAVAAVEGKFKDVEFLCWLAKEMEKRKY